MKSYVPAQGWLLLQAEELAEQTPGGIIKPAAAMEKERSLGGDKAPAFLVLAVGDVPSRFGTSSNQHTRTFPTVGSKVFVLNDRSKIVVLSKDMLLVHLDVIVGSVTEENA